MKWEWESCIPWILYYVTRHVTPLASQAYSHICVTHRIPIFTVQILQLVCFNKLCSLYRVLHNYFHVAENKLILIKYVMNIIFWGAIPCILVAVYRVFGGTYCLHLQDRRISQARITRKKHVWTLLDGKTSCLLLANCLVYSLVLKMEAIYSSGMSGKLYRTIRRHFPALHSHRHENFKFNI
jgi:hypothetical protein